MQHTLLYFPDYVHANPYQSLLYSGIDAVFQAQSGGIEDARLQAAAPGLGQPGHLPSALGGRDLPASAERGRGGQRMPALPRSARALSGGRRPVRLDDPQPGAARRALSRRPSRAVRQAREPGRPDPSAFLRRARGAGAGAGARAREGHGDPARQLPAAVSESRPRSSAVRVEDGRRFLLFGRLGRYKGGAELVQSFAGLDGCGRPAHDRGQADRPDRADRAAGRRSGTGSRFTIAISAMPTSWRCSARPISWSRPIARA